LNRAVHFQGVDVPDYEKVLNCMRCGMCLPHCPTYSLTRIERSSPRGRIALIRAVADGRLELTQGVEKELYFCLDCRACESACPAGVHVGYLIEAGRSQAERCRPHSFLDRAIKNLLFNYLFVYTPRLERIAFLMRLYQKTGLRKVVQKSGILSLFPAVFRFMEEFTPDGMELPLRRLVAEEIPAQGEEKARVGFFLGCMMSIFFGRCCRATIDLLTRSGCRVVIPKAVLCCGAPLASEGYRHRVPDLARFNIDLFEKQNVDYIVTDCAACGCSLKEYRELLKDNPQYAERAEHFSAKVRDISEFLASWPHYPKPVGGQMPEKMAGRGSGDGRNLNRPLRITYDQPCHLQHAQGISKQPHSLLKAIPGIEFVDLPESDWCCGSAGVYNITHYETSMKILDRKMDNIEKVAPDLLVTANPGCLLQLQYGVKKRNLDTRVCHITELLSTAQGNTIGR